MTTIEAAEITESEPIEHPSDAKYWQIAVVLGAITAIEVALSYAHIADGAKSALMLIGMAAKFFIVASFFMHLKFDSKVLRRFFIGGGILAIFCYMVVLFMFRDFSSKRVEINYKQSGIPGAQVPQIR